MIDDLSANRRDLLIAPLLAAMPAALLGGRADASPVDPAMTFTKLPEQITWEKARNRPPKTVEQALLWSKSSEPGLYYYLVKWYPGYMSAPHWYETDRLCVVVSGTWWVASGEDFQPNDTIPMPAGSFIRRRQDAALRRRQEGWQGTGRDCDLWHGADHLSPGQRGPAGFTRALTLALTLRTR